MSAERAPGARRPPAALWAFSNLLLAPLLYGPLRMRRAGRAHLPATGPLLLVANHVSVLDAVALALACWPRRRPAMMGMAPLFRVPLLGAYLRGMGAFPVVRDSADHGALRAARDLLARGEAVAVFPEGRVARDGRLRPGGAGVGALALRPDVRVVPVAIWGTQSFRGPVRVRFGPPLGLGAASAAPEGGGPRSARARAATAEIMAALARLVPAVGGPAQPGPGVAGV